MNTLKKFIKNLKDKQPLIKYIKGYKTLSSRVLVRDAFGTHRIKAKDLLSGLVPSVDTAVFKITYANNKVKAEHKEQSEIKQEVKVDTVIVPKSSSDKATVPKSSGFGRGDFVDRADGRECILYAIECYGGKPAEVFYKIGITSWSVEKRFASGFPYDYRIIHEIKGDAQYIWNLEKELHKAHKQLKYFPKQEFSGVTECFTGLIERHNGKQLWKDAIVDREEMKRSGISVGGVYVELP